MDTGFQVTKEQSIGLWHSDLACLAKHVDAIYITAQRFQQGIRILGRLTIVPFPVKEGKCKWRNQ